MGRITRDQSLAVMAALMTNTEWDTVDFDEAGLQDIVMRRQKEAGAAFTAWLNNGCQLSVKGPNTLTIDRSRPFDPATFIGKGWTVDEQDERSLALTEIDFGKASFVSGLKSGETHITGEVKLERLKAQTAIRLDAKIGQALYEEEGQVTLRFIHEHLKISWFELAGTVLRYPSGCRSFLSLYRRDGGSWRWDCHWLDYDRSAQGVSPVLAS